MTSVTSVHNAVALTAAQSDCSLVNGPKQPFGLFVKRHHHSMESRQLGGDLSGDVGIGELLCAHTRVLQKKGAKAESKHVKLGRRGKVGTANGRQEVAEAAPAASVRSRAPQTETSSPFMLHFAGGSFPTASKTLTVG